MAQNPRRVRRWGREGILKAGYWGGWQWTRGDEVVASIQMRVEHDRVILTYRYRSATMSGRMLNIRFASIEQPATLAALAVGLFAPRLTAADACDPLRWRDFRLPPMLPPRLPEFA